MEVAEDRGKAEWVRWSCSDGLVELKQHVQGISRENLQIWRALKKA